MARFRFAPREHLRRKADFDAVFRNRKSARDLRLIVHLRPNGFAFSRLGLSVGGKFGNACRRNHFRRLCREAFRLHKRELPAGFDLVVRPAASIGWKLPEIAESLVRLVKSLCEASA